MSSLATDPAIITAALGAAAAVARLLRTWLVVRAKERADHRADSASRSNR